MKILPSKATTMAAIYSVGLGACVSNPVTGCALAVSFFASNFFLTNLMEKNERIQQFQNSLDNSNKWLANCFIDDISNAEANCNHVSLLASIAITFIPQAKISFMAALAITVIASNIAKISYLKTPTAITRMYGHPPR